jgi:hypothetical protein
MADESCMALSRAVPLIRTGAQAAAAPHPAVRKNPLRETGIDFM